MTIHDSTCDHNCPHWGGRWQSGASLRSETVTVPSRRPCGHPTAIHSRRSEPDVECCGACLAATTEPVSRRDLAAAIERNRS